MLLQRSFSLRLQSKKTLKAPTLSPTQLPLALERVKPWISQCNMKNCEFLRCGQRTVHWEKLFERFDNKLEEPREEEQPAPKSKSELLKEIVGFEVKDELDMRVANQKMFDEKLRRLEPFDPADYGLEFNENEEKLYRLLEEYKKDALDQINNEGMSPDAWYEREFFADRESREFRDALILGDNSKYEEYMDQMERKSQRPPKQQEVWNKLLKLADPELKDYLLGHYEEYPQTKYLSEDEIDAEAKRALLGEKPDPEKFHLFQKEQYQKRRDRDPEYILRRIRDVDKRVQSLKRIREKYKSLMEYIAKGGDERQLVKILKTDEIKFDQSTVGAFMMLDKPDIQKWIPEGISGYLAEEVQYVHKGEKVSFLIRPETIKVIQRLEKSKEAGFLHNESPAFTLLSGEQGSGKSTILNEVVYWARTNGWLVLYVPDGPFWTQGFMDKNYKNDPNPHIIEASEREPRMINQPWHALTLGMALYQAHKDKLATLPIRLSSTTLPGFIKSDTSTLADLLKFGLNSLSTTTDTIFHIRRELNLVTEYPVLLVVDGVNYFYHKTGYTNPYTIRQVAFECIDPAKLVLPSCFMNYQNHGLVNGTVVATTSENSSNAMKNFRNLFPDYSSNNAVRVPVLRKPEFDSWMSYLEQFHFFMGYVPGGQRTQVYYMSGGRGHSAFKLIRNELM